MRIIGLLSGKQGWLPPVESNMAFRTDMIASQTDCLIKCCTMSMEE